MANHGFVLIEHPCRLSVNLGRIKLELRDKDPVFLLPSDLDVVCIDHPIVSLTTGVLKALSAAGVSLLITDDSHMPTAMMTSLSYAYSKPSRANAQWAYANSPESRIIWKIIVQSRIRSEAYVLKHLKRKGALYLERLAKKVDDGDTQNCEAQAARHYWKHLFGDDYRRTKQGAKDLVNSALNYGYAVLRASIAKGVVMHGLYPSVGIWHNSSENGFNLVDDLIELFRWVIELHVYTVFKDSNDEVFSSEAKRTLLAFIEIPITLDNQEYRLHSAIDIVVERLLAVYEGKAESIITPF